MKNKFEIENHICKALNEKIKSQTNQPSGKIEWVMQKWSLKQVGLVVYHLWSAAINRPTDRPTQRPDDDHSIPILPCIDR